MKIEALKRNAILSVAALLVSIAPLAQAANTSNSNNTNAPLSTLEQKVRHELVMLPYYSIFDDLSFQVEGRTVTLSGAVTRPILKSDAEGVVRHIEGVDRVVNKIEVLPLSPFDDRIRLAVARSIYGYGPLQRYGLGALPPIHIIVRNGNVTLTGVVLNSGDKNIANIRANQVPGVFSVTNELRTERS